MTASENYSGCLWKIYNFNFTAEKAFSICLHPTLPFATFSTRRKREAKIKEAYTSLLLKSHSDLLKRGMFLHVKWEEEKLKMCMHEHVPMWNAAK
jgi:hypothetical protein